MRTEKITVTPQQSLNNNPDTLGQPVHTTSEESNPFADLDSLRIGQEFSGALGKRLITTVPVRKPGNQDFIRVHEETEYRIETYVLELKEEREVYLVSPRLWTDPSNEISPRVIFTCINRQGVVFLWPIRRPDSMGRVDTWSASALAAAQAAMTRWVRVSANMSLGGYDVFEATGELPQPEWPAMTFKDLVRLAFQGRFIDTADHAVLRRLRGEV